MGSLEKNKYEMNGRKYLKACALSFASACFFVGSATGADYENEPTKFLILAPDEHDSASDPLNTVYTIEGQEISVRNGRSEAPIAPGSATKITTSISGKMVNGDLDGDGDEDAALFLVHDPGGSGTFYYVAVAVNEHGHYRGTNAVLLGDRILPRDLQIGNGVIVVGYLERRPHEPMSTAPSVEKSLHLILENGRPASLKTPGTDERRKGHE